MPLIWSTLPKKQLPQIGDKVRLCGDTKMLIVDGRFKAKELGTVYYTLRDPESQQFLEKIQCEIIEWFPGVNDIVLVATKPYMDWQQSLQPKEKKSKYVPDKGRTKKRQFHDCKLPLWTVSELKLQKIRGDLADVLPKKDTLKTVPLECLRVLKPCLKTREDLRSQNLDLAA